MLLSLILIWLFLLASLKIYQKLQPPLHNLFQVRINWQLDLHFYSLVSLLSGVLLSILAGKRVSEIQERFSTNLVIRTMPNTPASIMQGMTVWYPAKGVPQDVIERARQFLELTGSALLVSAENTLDMVSATLNWRSFCEHIHAHNCPLQRIDNELTFCVRRRYIWNGPSCA